MFYLHVITALKAVSVYSVRHASEHASKEKHGVGTLRDA